MPQNKSLSVIDQALESYNSTPDVINRAIEEYHQEEAAKNQHPIGRHAMQAAIGAGHGAILGRPITAAASLLADVSFGAQQKEALKQLNQENILSRELFPEAEIPEINMEQAQQGAEKAKQDLLSDENLTEGVIGAPFRIFGIDTNPQNFEEQVTRDTSRLLSASVTGSRSFRNGEFQKPTPGKPFSPNPGIPLTGKEQLKELTTIAPIATAAATSGAFMEQIWGVPGRIISDLIFGGSIAAGKYIKGKIKEFPYTRTELANQAMSPQQRDSVAPFIKIAKEKNIPLSLGTIADNPYIQAIENEIATNKLTRKEAQVFRQQAAKSWADSYQTTLKNTAQAAQYESPGAIAEKLKTDVLNPIQKAISQKASDTFNESRKLLAGAPPIPSEDIGKIEGSLNRVWEKVSKSLLPTSEEEAVQGVVRRGKKKIESKDVAAEDIIDSLEEIFGPHKNKFFVNEEGQLRFRQDVEITPDELIATIQSLNASLPWDYPGTASYLKDTRAVIKNILENRYGKNPDTALGVKKYNEANAIYQKNAQLFTGDQARYANWAINSKTTPEQLANQLNSVRKFQQFEKDFGTIPEGKQLIEFMKRKKLDSVIEDTFAQMRFQYQPGKVASKIGSLENNDFIKYLAGKSWKDFQKLAELDNFIAKNATSIYQSGIPQNTVTPFLESTHAIAMIASPTKVGIPTLLYRKGSQEARKYATTLFQHPELMSEAISIAEASPMWKVRPDYWTARLEKFNMQLKIAEEESNMLKNINQP